MLNKRFQQALPADAYARRVKNQKRGMAMQDSSPSSAGYGEINAQIGTEPPDSTLEIKQQELEKAKSEYNFFSQLLGVREEKANELWGIYSDQSSQANRLVSLRDRLNQDLRDKRKEIRALEKSLEDARTDLGELQERADTVRHSLRSARRKVIAALSEFESANGKHLNAEHMLDIASLRLRSAEIAFELAGGELPREENLSTKSNPWHAGSFYLFAAVVIMTLLAVISINVPWQALPIVFIGGLLTIVIIGALQLQNDDRFKNEEFLVLVLEVLKSLPFLRNVSLRSQDTSAETRSTQEDISGQEVSPDSGKRKLEHQPLIRLLEVLDDHFDAEELRTLCFNLNVDYDNLPTEGKANKARELILHLERHDRVSELIEVGKRLRPDIPWVNTSEQTSEDL